MHRTLLESQTKRPRRNRGDGGRRKRLLTVAFWYVCIWCPRKVLSVDKNEQKLKLVK